MTEELKPLFSREDIAETVARLAIELGSRGTLQTTTMAAMELDDFINNLK